MKTLFTKVTDLSDHTGPFVKLADNLLSCVAPKHTAKADICTQWENVGCCGYRSVRYRRYCFFDPGMPIPYYTCQVSFNCG